MRRVDACRGGPWKFDGLALTFLRREFSTTQQHEQQQLLTAASVRGKRADMERQAHLQAQMQVAFRTGDQETYRRLKAQLEPSE